MCAFVRAWVKKTHIMRRINIPGVVKLFARCKYTRIINKKFANCGDGIAAFILLFASNFITPTFIHTHTHTHTQTHAYIHANIFVYTHALQQKTSKRLSW